eukprot:scaffold3118_cov64-Cylindrotheca_fusiformis.AAC.13
MKVGSYFWPYSINFPSYDAAAIVDSGTLGMTGSRPVALLFQRTVSGATNLSCRPGHEVKKFDSAFEAGVPEYRKDSAITTFVVPSECFETFQFMAETVSRGEDMEAREQQPARQLVIEMPGPFSLNKNTKRLLEQVLDRELSRKQHRYPQGKTTPS